MGIVKEMMMAEAESQMSTEECIRCGEYLTKDNVILEQTLCDYCQHITDKSRDE